MRKEVIRKQHDFDRLHSKGKSIGSKYAVLVYLPNSLGYPRLAFIASKKIGNSINRHRAVRLLRESYRQILKEYEIPEGMDYLFIARSNIIDSKCADVKKAIEAAMNKEGLLKNKEA